MCDGGLFLGRDLFFFFEFSHLEHGIAAQGIPLFFIFVFTGLGWAGVRIGVSWGTNRQERKHGYLDAECHGLDGDILFGIDSIVPG